MGVQHMCIPYGLDGGHGEREMKVYKPPLSSGGALAALSAVVAALLGVDVRRCVVLRRRTCPRCQPPGESGG